MPKKLDHTERKELVSSIKNVIGTIEAIDDKETQDKLCQEIINLCDQIKYKLIMDMWRAK